MATEPVTSDLRVTVSADPDRGTGVGVGVLHDEIVVSQTPALVCPTVVLAVGPVDSAAHGGDEGCLAQVATRPGPPVVVFLIRARGCRLAGATHEVVGAGADGDGVLVCSC